MIKTSVLFFDKSVKFLEILRKYPIYLFNVFVKVANIRHVLLNYIESFSLFSVCLQINGKQNTTFQFSVKLFSNKMHEATFKLDLTQRQYVNGSYLVVATNH